MARDTTSLGFKHRCAFKLLTAANHKTPKGEASGYFSAILYLAPHTLGGGATLCPHSTPDCRAMCLAGAGQSGLPLQVQAKLNRTRMFNERRGEFLAILAADVARLRKIAAMEGLKPVLRLNGTSDVLWERIVPGWADLKVQRMDYTKVPLHLRRADPGYHLTYSYMGPQDAERAVGYLNAGHSVAVVVPEALKETLLGDGGRARFVGAQVAAHVVDGDAHDLRFLDPPGSLVLLKPKGRVLTGLVRPDVLRELAAVRVAA